MSLDPGSLTRRKTKRTVVVVAVVAVAIVGSMLAFGTAAGVVHWRLPDQSAMTEYVETNPFDSYPELSDRRINKDGTNYHLCFMCSTYGITMAYDLIEIVGELEQRAFCDRVAATLAEWQRAPEVESDGWAEEQVCSFTVRHIRDHGSWTMQVVVAFLPYEQYPGSHPPQLLVGIDDYTV